MAEHDAEGNVIPHPFQELLWEAMEYAQHNAWRCEHPDRYPHDPDCPCGLMGFTSRVRDSAGSPPAGWTPPPIGTFPAEEGDGRVDLGPERMRVVDAPNGGLDVVPEEDVDA